MSEILDWASDAAKDTTSHMTVAGLITFSHENKLIAIAAVIVTTLLCLVWVYHLYKMWKNRGVKSEAKG